jgi:hypothetical protein
MEAAVVVNVLPSPKSHLRLTIELPLEAVD